MPRSLTAMKISHFGRGVLAVIPLAVSALVLVVIGCLFDFGHGSTGRAIGTFIAELTGPLVDFIEDDELERLTLAASDDD